jgi:predicted TIM-barrel fold metal-dependent hydrolase
MTPSYIDADTHVYEPIGIFAKYADPAIRKYAPTWVRDDDSALRFSIDNMVFPPAGLINGGFDFIFGDGSPYRQIKGAYDPVERLKYMDEEGAETHLIFPSLAQFGFSRVRDPRVAGGLCRSYNRWIAEFASVDRKRLKPTMIVPFNHPDVALDEMKFARETLGLEILHAGPTPPPGMSWHGHALDPIWDYAQDSDTFVAFLDSCSAASNGVGLDRDYTYPMIYMCGKVVETQLAVMDLIFGGVLQRFPRLLVGFFECFAAWFPGWIELLDSQFPKVGTMYKGGKGPLDLLPSEYFRRQCFLQVMADDGLVSEAVSAAGEDRILFGTDFPHPIAGTAGVMDKDAGGRFRAMQSAIMPSIAEKILRGNAPPVLRP